MEMLTFPCLFRYREERTLNNLIDHVKEKYYTAIEDDLKFNTKPFRISSQNVWNVLGVRWVKLFYFSCICNRVSKFRASQLRIPEFCAQVGLTAYG